MKQTRTGAQQRPLLFLFVIPAVSSHCQRRYGVNSGKKMLGLLREFYAEGVPQQSPGPVIRATARITPPWVDVNLIDRPRNQATTCPPARRGRNNARRIAVSAKWRIEVAVILDRCVFLPANPGWRHAAAPLGLPWALMCNTFGVLILEKTQYHKTPAKGTPGFPSLALQASIVRLPPKA